MQGSKHLKIQGDKRKLSFRLEMAKAGFFTDKRHTRNRLCSKAVRYNIFHTVSKQHKYKINQLIHFNYQAL